MRQFSAEHRLNGGEFIESGRYDLSDFIRGTDDLENDRLIDLYKQGLAKGEAKEAKRIHEATVVMLKKGYATAEICEILEVSEEYVLNIKKELEE